MGKLYNYVNNTSYAFPKISAPREVTLFSFNHWVQNISKNLLFFYSFIPMAKIYSLNQNMS